MAVYTDIPGSVIRYPDGEVDVDPPYSAAEQARDDWLDSHDAEMADAEAAYQRDLAANGDPDMDAAEAALLRDETEAP